MALITSPLIGLYSVVPPLLFMQSMPASMQFRLGVKADALLFAIPLVTLNVAMLWLINIVLVRRLYSPQKPSNQTKRIVISFICILVMIGIMSAFGGPPNREELGAFRYYPIIGGITNNTFILLLINLILRKSEKDRMALLNAELEISNLQARQQSLRQQMHPHFLFNALGTLKILIGRDQKAADQYVAKLSSFLRASIADAHDSFISIKDDIDYLNDYMALQKIRFGEALEYHLEIPEAFMTMKLPGYCLQVLAENAIKHNAFSSTEKLDLKFDVEQGYLCCVNNYRPKKTDTKREGTGLKNLEERFALYGLEKPVYFVDGENQTFVVKLKPSE